MIRKMDGRSFLISTKKGIDSEKGGEGGIRMNAYAFETWKIPLNPNNVALIVAII